MNAGVPAEPRSLADKKQVDARRALLCAPRMQDLNNYVADLRTEGRGSVPDFDPMDGGSEAQILLLLEKPGPMTDPSKKGKLGSGFVSRDNDDATAESVFRFMVKAGIPRERTIIWNAIPWWNGHIRLTAAEIDEGHKRLGELLGLLPQLRGVVAAGRKAQRAEPLVRSLGRDWSFSAHPSPVNRAFNRPAWDRIWQDWKRAWDLVKD